MNKTLKAILAAAGALILGGIGEGIGSELLKRAAKDDDTADANGGDSNNATEESEDVAIEEVSEETETD